MNKIDQLKEFSRQIQDLKKEVSDSFYYLESGALNFHPAPGKWSILQCLDHLNLAHEIYVNTIGQALSLAGDAPQVENVKVSLKGKFLAWSMRPKKDKIKFKTKTFPYTRPVGDENYEEKADAQKIFKAFFLLLDQLDAHLKTAEKKKLKGLKVNSLAGEKIKFSLMDAYAFVLAHAERHVWQAKNIANTLQPI